MWSNGKPPACSENKGEECFYRGKGEFKSAVLKVLWMELGVQSHGFSLVGLGGCRAKKDPPSGVVE